MVKFIVSILLIALLSLAAGLYLPWFCIAVAAFIVAALIPQKPYKAFLSGFIALFILWGSMCLIISNNNQNLLAAKVSMIILKNNNSLLLIIISALIGALVAGFGALTGSYTRRNIVAKKVVVG